MLSCCCNHFGVKAMGLMGRGWGHGHPSSRVSSPPGFPLPSSPHGSPLPFPLFLPSPPGSPSESTTETTYELIRTVFCLFVCLCFACTDYFKLFEVAKERQLNCELWFVFLVGSRGCNIHVVSSHRRIHPCWHRTPNQLVLFLLPRPQAVSAF